MDLKDQFHHIQNVFPQEGLFDSKEWRQAVKPFPISKKLYKDFENFGKVFLKFYQAINQCYRFSLQNREPCWVSDWLNAGIPKSLQDLQQSKTFQHAIPRVIRPDVLLTEDGWVVTELDSVPGGIGLTSWLNSTYQSLGYDVIGSDEVMVSQFLKIFPEEGDIHFIVSEESSTYRPEMSYLAKQLRNIASHRKIHLQDERFTKFSQGDSIYRFFELFDLDNVPSAQTIFDRAHAKELFCTPPPKTILEEKLNLALLWNRNLQDFWIRELGNSFFEKLKRVVPRSWVMDPTPMPPQASIAGLDITDWHQLKLLSQKKRNYIIKVSGYSENAWGARGVHLGSDLSADEWSESVDVAIQSFESSPYIMQEYKKPARVETSWIHPETYEEIPMKARVRLCPYYFVHGDQDKYSISLAGILATLCPEDKKIIHGMSEAVLAPCIVE